MSGYHGFSKSNNAILAEENGEFPATIAAKKLGVSTTAVKVFLTPCAWHHTGKMYREIRSRLLILVDMADYVYDLVRKELEKGESK